MKPLLHIRPPDQGVRYDAARRRKVKQSDTRRPSTTFPTSLIPKSSIAKTIITAPNTPLFFPSPQPLGSVPPISDLFRVNVENETMPAQKHSSDDATGSPDEEASDRLPPDHSNSHRQRQPQEEDDKADDSGSSSSSSSEEEKEQFVLVKLSEVRKEVQCSICLGIIRKTRTVMECLHRFCRECIDKSMRMGNNECPACRTHCASRRSLRDDPNYDALITALYPDIDKYEEEELTFQEEEKARNKQIQAAIAQTVQRQSEALHKKRAARGTGSGFARRSQSRRRGRGVHRTSELQGSDDNEDASRDMDKGSSSDDDNGTELKSRRSRRWGDQFSHRSSAASADGSGDGNDFEVNREHICISAGLVGPSNGLAWGKGGMRSHTRYGSPAGGNGSHSRHNTLGVGNGSHTRYSCLVVGNGSHTRYSSLGGGDGSHTRSSSLSGGSKSARSRLSKLAGYLRNLEEKDEELDVNLMLVPVDEQRIPHLQQPYLCCRPTLSIKHLCQYVALETALQANEIEIYMVKEPWPQLKPSSSTASKWTVVEASEDKLQILKEEETLAELKAPTLWHGHLVLAYEKK